jgi:uncharacterized protein (TIGR02271 family)
LFLRVMNWADPAFLDMGSVRTAHDFSIKPSHQKRIFDMTLTADQLQGLLGRGAKVVDRDGAKIGGIGQVYLDDETGAPEWVTVKTGLFGSSESFVPLRGAGTNGDDIAVDYDKNTVKDAPRVDSDGHLSHQDEKQLYAYYGLSEQFATNGQHGKAETAAPKSTKGRDTSGPTTDTAMTRSEERLRVGVRTRQAGRARLRKFVVTENVSATIPLRREEARITREPVTDANRAQSMDGPEITEAVHEVTLHAERPVVEKKAVPVERVKLNTEKVTEQATVDETVRKEHLEVDGDVRPDANADLRP